MPGRPRKPTELKLIEGTFRPDRANPNEPTGEVVLLIAPEWLPARAAEIFDQLAAYVVGANLSLAGDVYALGLLALRLHEVEYCTIALDEHGPTYWTENAAGERLCKRRPEVAIRAEAAKHAQSLMHEFGLTPATRSKVSVLRTIDVNPFLSL